MAKKKLQLKKEFRKGRSTRHIEGFGRVIFDPEKVKESLANMNLLVEDWGGKIKSLDISAKKGSGVE